MVWNDECGTVKWTDLITLPQCNHMFKEISLLQMWREWDTGAALYRCLYWPSTDQRFVPLFGHKTGYSDTLLALYITASCFTGNEQQWHGTNFIQHHSSAWELYPATSCHICPSLTWPQSHSFSLISIIHEGPLAFPFHCCHPQRSAEAGPPAASNPSCSESQCLDRVFIHHTGEISPTMILPKYF